MATVSRGEAGSIVWVCVCVCLCVAGLQVWIAKGDEDETGGGGGSECGADVTRKRRHARTIGRLKRLCAMEGEVRGERERGGGEREEEKGRKKKRLTKLLRCS